MNCECWPSISQIVSHMSTKHGCRAKHAADHGYTKPVLIAYAHNSAEVRMDAREIANIILNPAPRWQRPKPCAVCRVEFVPEYHWQECCYQHQLFATVTGHDTSGVKDA
jgi:hypothetical protein